MVIGKLLEDAFKKLSSIPNHKFEARQIVAFALGFSSAELILKRNEEVSKESEAKIEKLIKIRLSGEPLQYILGSQEFMSLPFLVSPDTLIPRQDTETLVEFILDEKPDFELSVLDIGTGTGCIPISLAHFRKKFSCYGIDISKNAIELAKKNAENLGVSPRVKFGLCDILSDIPSGKFDIVVSNPPYIKSGDIEALQKEVKDFEPHLALDGGNDGLEFYRRISMIAPKILKNGGLLALEIGFDQADAVSDLLKNDFCDIKIIKDLCGNDRVASGYLNTL